MNICGFHDLIIAHANHSVNNFFDYSFLFFDIFFVLFDILCFFAGIFFLLSELYDIVTSEQNETTG